jgi:hypothetical protein
MSKTVLMALAVILCCQINLAAQELEPDVNTLLLLHFDGSADGVNGETPVVNTATSYVEGVHGQAIRGGDSSDLAFLADGELDQEQGTFEAWVKTRWAGNDLENRTLFYYQWGNGMLLEKDGGRHWVMLKDFAPPEFLNSGLGWFAGNWQAEQWYHIAFTWSPTESEIYVNGRRVSQRSHDVGVFPVTDTVFRLLGDGGGRRFLGDVDELRISDRVRSSQEIFESFLAGTDVQGFVLDQPEAELYPTWRHWLTGHVETGDGDLNIDPSSLDWSSDNPDVADFDFEQGYITAHSPGTATLTASIGDLTSTVTVNVAAPLLEPDLEQNIDPSLTTPMEGSLKEMPVVVITYIPTLDGATLDTDEASNVHGPLTIQQLKDRVDRLAIQTKFMLEERTKFRGYKNTDSNPYLGYRITKHIYVYEPVPRLKPHQTGSLMDYWPIMKRFGIEDEVDLNGVKEVWINAYHTAAFAGWESNMSSPVTGDVSNSDRSNDDLPIASKTYLVYGYNYHRTNAENVHNHGHQLESMFSHLNWLQDGNVDLFWKDFVGRGPNNEPPLGRVGDTHHPPNTTVDYDYYNGTLVASDAEEWQHSGGPTELVNADTWGQITYDWPYGVLPWQLGESNFYIYWMQNMPGPMNQIPHGNRKMENWWRHIHDWDASIIEGRGLHTSEHTADEVTIERGLLTSGNRLSLLERDDLPYRVRRNPINPQSRADVRIRTVSAPANPTKLEFHVSTRVFSRSNITQKISLFNFQTDQFEELDSSVTTRINYDDRVVEASGDLSRFLDPDTRRVEARVEFIANRNRQKFTASIDQGIFIIEQASPESSAPRTILSAPPIEPICTCPHCRHPQIPDSKTAPKQTSERLK